MANKKITKVITAIIAVVAFALIITAVIISLSGNKSEIEKDGYKQCSKKENVGDEKTNFEHTGINYYIDKKNNRINNSEALAQIHNSEDNSLSIDKMTIKSENCDENFAEFNATLTNNLNVDLSNFMLVFEIKDSDGKMTHKFSMDIDNIAQGETIPIKLKTLGRIIDAYDYDFTYVTPNELDG